MDRFSIGDMIAKNIASQFGASEDDMSKASDNEMKKEETKGKEAESLEKKTAGSGSWSEKRGDMIKNISNEDFKRIVMAMEKFDPSSDAAVKYLQHLDDRKLRNFVACAEHYKDDKENINEKTRSNCKAWGDLAMGELMDRHDDNNWKRDKPDKKQAEEK